MRLCFAAPARRLVLLGLTLAALGLLGCSSGGDGGDGGNGGGNNTRTLSGRVTNASTGNPVNGATVTAAGRSTTTLADGTYQLTGLPNTGDLIVTVTATGFEDFSITITDTSQTALNASLVPETGGGFDVTQPPLPPDFSSVGL